MTAMHRTEFEPGMASNLPEFLPHSPGPGGTEQAVCSEPNSGKKRRLGISREILTRINHEVRTPMNGILGFADLLLETPLTPDQKGYVETIEQCGLSLLSFWDTVLELWTMEVADLQLVRFEFRPLPVIQEAAESMRSRASRKGLKLDEQSTLSPETRIFADPSRFRQILYCLLDNAVKFTSIGTISIGCEEISGNRIRVAVRDTGPGIPSDKLGKLFRPFFQIDSTPTRREIGCGLGLAMARRLVELQGGQIGCESHIDCGSTFWFTLPINDLPLE